MIPGFKKEFPDLDRRMMQELAKASASRGCNRTCLKTEIIRKYARLADERRTRLKTAP